MSSLARYCLACLIAGALAGWSAWQVQDWRWTSRVNAEKLAQSEAARQREKALSIANQGVDREYQTQKARIAADTKRLADGLRDLRAVLESGVDSAPLGGADDPRDAIIDQCATAVVGLDGEVKGLALKATGLQNYARLVCLAK